MTIMQMLTNPAPVRPYKLRKGSAGGSSGGPAVLLTASKLFCTLPELYSKPKREYVINGLLLADSLTVFFGKPKTGKSFLMIDLVCSISLGKDWLGRAVKQGTAVYIGLEGSGSLPDRFRAWETDRGVCPVPNSLVWDGGSLNVFDDTVVNGVIAELKSLHTKENPLRLVVIDPLARVVAGADENTSATMSKVVDFADRIRSETGAAVVIVHHTSKSSEGTGPRGHGALLGAVDTAVEIKQVSGKPHTAKSTAQRDLPTDFDIAFRLKPVAIKRQDNSTGESCVVELVRTGPSTKQTQVDEDADTLARTLRQQIEENAGKQAPQGGSPINGTEKDLDAAKDIFFADRMEEAGQGETEDEAQMQKMRDSARKRFDRAKKKLLADKRLVVDGEKITLNLPAEDNLSEVPF